MSRNVKREELLKRLSLLPKRILTLYGVDIPYNLAEFVLHELCEGDCFNIKRAAFLVDNPDFDIFKGVAGFEKEESFKKSKASHWDEPEEFSNHMKRCNYNQKVRSLEKCSSKKKNQAEKEVLSELSKELGFKSPSIHTWPLKYDNHGVLVFEVEQGLDSDLEDHLKNIIYIFSFSPVS